MNAAANWTLGLAVLAITNGGLYAGVDEEIFSDGFESGDTSAWSGSPPTCGTVVFAETFPVDGPNWGGDWTVAGNVDVADVVGSESRLRPNPTGYSLARMFHPISTLDVEVEFTLRFEDVATQGVGFYVRQNGGYLTETTPFGEGYAVFVQGFQPPDSIDLWREVDGDEQMRARTTDGIDLQDEVPYRVRFRVNQMDPSTTLLQAKIWPEAGAEPPGWQVEVTDNTASLQETTGGIAVDSWSVFQQPNPITAHTFVDDITVTRLCNPLAGVLSLSPVSESFLFTEGPLWRNDHLLFTDLDADTIYRLDPASDISAFRNPSQEANGLASLPNGDLLAAERNPPRISQTVGGDPPITLVGDYQGSNFNAPNDIAVRSDGVVYFTDPTYGMVGFPEIGFNGVFRWHPTLGLTAEWEGVSGVNEPNGIGLSSDESRLYVTDTNSGTLLAWDVNPDGSLEGMETLVSGLTIPDGLCVDRDGNIWVATWASNVEVFAPDGTPWGEISVPQQATNCCFGSVDGRTLYVTAHTGLYRAAVPIGGPVSP